MIGYQVIDIRYNYISEATTEILLGSYIPPDSIDDTKNMFQEISLLKRGIYKPDPKVKH